MHDDIYIMVVGGHSKNTELLARTLEAAGYRVERRTNLPGDGNDLPALLIYDTISPAPGLCSALESYVRAGTKVMVFLPRPSPSIEHLCREKGVHAIFSKPISRAQLLEWTALLLKGG
ncbi:hypothetical protein Spith_0253 [Spirochaeta thermophila DSM 6578]|uniref:Response regulatory domain-containing protein n=1 Tax=Winmispira thermophila (strain ATCC 700085 / DSM 6578 / Z-1203) TaxID=869211 RepID=G0GDB3_WINT7|nr:hypothetical protein [Spirochaeta thermophila]AEJ60539.1 hypothetical protein Spith_0253 [Spirochaeta thermophila DSM 6578]